MPSKNTSSPSPPLTHSPPTLTLHAAKLALAACEAHASQRKLPMNIALSSSSTHLLAFSAMDGAKKTSIAIAQDKAFTAAGHGAPTHLYKENVWPGGPAYGIQGSNGGRFCVIGGGVPVRDREGRVLGAVGVSGGTPAEDLEVAMQGVRALEGLLGREEEVKAKL